MKTLAFDTSTMAVSLAVLDGPKIISQYHLEGQVRHSEALIDMVEETFSHLNFDLKDLDLIAVGMGPGSFTGLRISITGAKILAQVLGIPLKGVSSLESLVGQIDLDGTIVPVLDARRHRLYSSYFTKEGGQVTRLSPDEARDIDQIVEDLKDLEDLVFVGDGLETAREELETRLPQARFISPMNSTIRGASIGFLAQARFAQEGGDNLYEMEPNYLRPSQAMREYREKHGKDIQV